MPILSTLLALTAFATPQSSVVTWKLRDSTGNPVSRAEVTLVGPVGSPYIPMPMYSNAQGEATIKLIKPGRYYVLAGHKSSGHAFLQFDSPGRDTLSSVLIPVNAPTAVCRFFDSDTSEVASGVKISKVSNPAVKVTTSGTEFQFIYPSNSPVSCQFEATSIRQFNRPVVVSVPFTDQPSCSVRAFGLNNAGGSAKPTTSEVIVAKSNYKLDGMIRMADRNRIVVGKLCTVSVNLLYTGGAASTANSVLSVVIKDPSGKIVVNYEASHPLTLNAYAEKKFEVTPAVAGKYTVYVQGTGEHNSKWDGTFSFTANAK